MNFLGVTERGSWNVVARESFGLQPRQLSTLCAIVAYWEATGEPIPNVELHRLERTEHDPVYRVDRGCVNQLVKQGLVVRLGTAAKRHWKPTRAGIARPRA